MINPLVREEDAPKHIPYGLSLLAAIALENNHKVQVYDANAWRKGDDVLQKVLAADDWDVISIGGLTTAYRSIKKTLRFARRVSPQSTLVVGGGFVTSMPLEIMEWLPEIDLAIVGEAFVTWPEVLGMIDRQEDDFSKTLGVCYRDKKSGTPILTDVRPNIQDIDVLPYPAWDLLPMDIYFKNSQLLYSEESFTSRRRVDINGSLGCSLVCRYCWHLGTIGDMTIGKNEQGINDVRFSYGRNIRYHSADYIVTMVNTLVRKFQIDFISFIDENLMTMDAYSGRTWLKELSDKWIKAGLQPTCRREGVPHDQNCKGVHWSGTSHASLARRDVLESIYKAGCSHLVYGIESFDAPILKKLGKGTTVKQNFKSLTECLDVGIIPIPNFIIGFPEETFESIRNTMDGLIRLGIYCKPHFATPYPGSEWYYTYKHDILKQYHGSLESFIEDLGDASKITAVISHNFSALELLGFQQMMVNRDRRSLDLAERHWGEAQNHMVPLAAPMESFNFISKNVRAP